jgi:hypothetical protein
MVPDFSSPLNGLNGFQRATWDTEKVAQRITSPQEQQGARSEEGGAAAVGLDPAAATAMVAQVENTAEANPRALSTQDEVTRSMLNLFA